MPDAMPINPVNVILFDGRKRNDDCSLLFFRRRFTLDKVIMQNHIAIVRKRGRRTECEQEYTKEYP